MVPAPESGPPAWRGPTTIHNCRRHTCAHAAPAAGAKNLVAGNSADTTIAAIDAPAKTTRRVGLAVVRWTSGTQAVLPFPPPRAVNRQYKSAARRRSRAPVSAFFFSFVFFFFFFFFFRLPGRTRWHNRRPGQPRSFPSYGRARFLFRHNLSPPVSPAVDLPLGPFASDPPNQAIRASHAVSAPHRHSKQLGLWFMNHGRPNSQLPPCKAHHACRRASPPPQSRTAQPGSASRQGPPSRRHRTAMIPKRGRRSRPIPNRRAACWLLPPPHNQRKTKPEPPKRVM